jgi:hypothetical protein
MFNSEARYAGYAALMTEINTDNVSVSITELKEIIKEILKPPKFM